MLRYTDTTKWQDPWYRRLPSQYKLLWEYVLDNCNMAGVWEEDLDMVRFCIGVEFEKSEVFERFNNGKRRVEEVGGGKWLIPHYVDKQWGGCLHPASPTHNRVLKEIYAEGVQDRVTGRVPPLDSKVNGAKYKAIVDDLNEVCGTQYKHTTQTTRDKIRARLREGFTVEDFKKVHRNKQAEWGNDNYWRQYLRPQTLYSNKFEGYLNQPRRSEFEQKYNL